MSQRTLPPTQRAPRSGPTRSATTTTTRLTAAMAMAFETSGGRLSWLSESGQWAGDATSGAPPRATLRNTSGKARS